jgi:hypothetical protein
VCRAVSQDRWAARTCLPSEEMSNTLACLCGACAAVNVPLRGRARPLSPRLGSLLYVYWEWGGPALSARQAGMLAPFCLPSANSSWCRRQHAGICCFALCLLPGDPFN